MKQANREILGLVIGVIIQKLMERLIGGRKDGPEHRT
jgi:hypothetical protein